MVQQILTAFALVFLLWVLFGPAFNDAKDDKKKKSDNKGGGLLLGLLFAPFVVAGWLLFGLGQMSLLLAQAIAALWEAIVPLFRKIFEMIGRLLEWLWKLLKKLFRNAGPLLKGILGTIRYALKTIWNAFEGMFKAIAYAFRSLFSFMGDLIRDFPGVIRTLRNLLKPFAWMLKVLRDAFGKILDWLFFLMDGLLAAIGRGNRKTKEYVSRDIEETDPTEAADLLMAVPLAVATAATRTTKTVKRGRQRLIASNPLKKGVTQKRKKDDPHVMARLRQIGWETRRKMGKA